MTCPQCQLPNPVGTSYCARCGTPLAGGPGAPPPARSGGGSRTLVTVLIVLGVAFVGCIGIGIIAAIAIPSLLRARISANESSAIGDVRTVISAQAAYQSANGGYYDTLECLGTPSGCIPNYDGPTFLDRALASGAPKTGYRRTFHPGAAASSAQGASSRSPSSLESFAYTAVPLQANQTGVRGFCGDATGRLCYTLDGSEPEVENGECSKTCQSLR
jgi:type II secretory pathway pseudopilin PulG